MVIILSIVLSWRVKVYNAKYKQLTKGQLAMFENGDPDSINPELGVDDQANLLPYNKSFEFEREKLKLGKQLGSGAFGRVVKAQAIGINSWERSKIASLPRAISDLKHFHRKCKIKNVGIIKIY